MSHTGNASAFTAHLAQALGAKSTQAHRVLARLRELLRGDDVAAATLLMFESDPQSDYPRQRLSQVLATQLDAGTLEQLASELQSSTQAPGINSSIEAGEEAVVERSGHKIVAPDVPVNVGTRAGTRGRISDSGVTIIGKTVSPQEPSPTQPAAQRPARGTLPATLSADGTHFSYGHALLIGVGTYHRTNLTAPSTANDAARLKQLLEDTQLAAYNPAQVTLLQNEHATRARILAALDDLAAQLQGAQTPQRPTVLLFFAGHGLQRENTFYLLPHDYDRDAIAGTALDNRTVREKIQALAAASQKLVVLLNCCHAGGTSGAVLSDDAGNETGAPPRDFISSLAEGSGQVVISSSRPEQVSSAEAADDSGLTTFGSTLLGGLRGDAPGSGPAIRIFDLFAHLAATVPADAAGVSYQGAPLVQQRDDVVRALGAM
jgi:hypothetical protein